MIPGWLSLVAQKRDPEQRNPWTIKPLWPKLPIPHVTVQTKGIVGDWGLLILCWFGVLLPSGLHILWGFSGSFGEFPIGLVHTPPSVGCPLHCFPTRHNFQQEYLLPIWVIPRKGHFPLYTTGEEQQKKFQGIVRTSYPMVLYLQKTRVTLKIQFSAVKQWESNLQRSGSHLELVHMEWMQNVSDSLCHSSQRMAESAVEMNPEKQKLFLKEILFPDWLSPGLVF